MSSVYTEWEKHKLSVRGLSALCVATAVACLLLLGVDLLLFRQERPTAYFDGFIARFALSLSAAVAFGVGIAAQRRRADLSVPLGLATLVLMMTTVAGGLAAAAAGGSECPYPFGLVPVVWLWALVIPGGARDAMVPTTMAFAAHWVTLAFASGGLGPEAVPSAVLLGLSILFAVATAEAVERWRQRSARISNTDWLTGALTRERLVEQLRSLCAHRQRSLAPVSLVMFDLDRFKTLNHEWGRAAGDEVLELLANSVRSEIRATDFVGRYGGDEFLLVLDECEGEAAIGLIERLRRRLAQSPMRVRDMDLKVTFSAGIVSMRPGEVPPLEDLLHSAEKALEDSKETGRSRTALAPPPPPHETPTQA